MMTNLLFNRLTAIGNRLAMVLTMFVVVGIGQAWGATTNYTFTSAKWADSSNGWTSGKDGAGYSNSGVQVTKNGTGAYATSKTSFTNISAISVNYCTNKSSGAGTIVLTVGSTSKTLTVSSSGGTTMRVLSTSFDTNVSGTVKITVNCTENSIYVGGITITTEEVASCTEPTITFSNGSYTIGGSVLDLSTLFDSNSNGAVTYSVTNANGTGATISGSNFTATATGSAKVSATQAAAGSYCAGSATATITVTKQQTTITLSEAGQTSNPSGTFYVGDMYQLPSTTKATCGDKTFVGWSTVEIDNSAEKPTSNFHERGASVTLGATNTFYAVFAETGGTPTTTWPKTEIANIKSTDEVVITMSNGVTTWALRNDDGTSAAPYAESITITNEQISSKVGDVQIWNISNSSGNLTIYPKGGTSTWLYCTNTNNGVRVGTNENKTFTISGNYLKNTATSRYVGVYVTNPDWRCYDNTAGNIAGQTLAFYAKTTTTGYQNYTTSCSTQTSLSVTYDGNGNTSGSVPIDATEYEKDDQVTVLDNTNLAKTGYTFSGWNTQADGSGTPYTAGATFAITENTTLYAQWTAYTINWTINPIAGGSLSATSGNSTTVTPDAAYTYGDPAYTVTSGTATVSQNDNTFSAVPTANSTIQINMVEKPKYTVTLNADPGTCAASVTEASAGAGVELPTPTLDCGDWEFAGWKTTSAVTTETTTEPTLIPAGAYSPTSDITLYAVYQRTETTDGGGGGGVATGTISFVNTTQRDSRTNEQQVWSNEDIIFTNNKSSSTTNVADYSNPARFYANSQIIISAPGAITQIVADCDESQYATALSNSIEDDNTVSGVNITITPSESSNTYTIVSLSAQTRLNSLTVTYTSGGGSSSTTYYHSTPDCTTPCEQLGAATGLTVETNYVHTDGKTYVKFSWTPADNTKANATNQKLCFGKVDEAGTCVDDLDKNQTWTGDLKSKLEPGEYWWSIQALGDGVNYCDGDVVNGTNFTIEAPKASITLSELGVTSTIDTYSVGDQYTLPTTSSQSCAGKQLVGWSRVEVAETDTKPTENYYELGAEVTLAAEQTFYAVYATLTAGGEGTITKINADDDFYYGDKIIIIAENTNYGLYRSSSSNYVSYWTTSNNNGVPTPTEIEADAKRCIEISEGTTEETFKLGNATDGYLYNPSSTNLSISQENASDWELIAWTDNTFTFKAVQYLSCRTDITGTNANKWRGAGESCDCETNEQCSGTIYYNIYRYTSGTSYTAYTTSCIPTYSITYDFAGGTGSHCSNTSVPQGDPYTICEEEPTKEGHTFLGWWDGTIRRAAGETINPTGHVTLTAQWQINTYTVTWSNNGEIEVQLYNHGDALIVPEAPESCDGVKQFVGWTTHSGYYHATTAPDDIFTTKTTPVTATATYYAVFATPPGTGGGGGGSETITLDFTAQEYANETAISNLTVDGVTATFDKGSNSNAPKYYTNGTAIRAYGGNTITLSANQITAATFTFGSSDGSNGITADCGSWDSPTWTGDATDKVVFTIGGTSGNRRIQSIEVTCTSGGGSGSYSDYTTICQQIESIEVQNPQTEFYLTDNFTIGEGKVIATLSGGGTADVTALATFSGYNMEVVGTYTVTVTYMGATATYNINVKPLDNAWVLTWNVSGKTNTGLGPRYVTKGSAIGTLPTPEIPAACAGKTFMGWTTSNIVNSDGTGITYITSETVPTDNTTYYAVFATVNNFCTQKPIDQIASGSKVVIVAVASLTDDGGAGKAISSRATDDTYNLQGDDVAIYDQTINTPHSTCIWTITKSGEKYIFTQGGKYLNAIYDDGHYNMRYSNTQDTWTITDVDGMVNTYRMQSTVTNYFAEFFKGKFTLYYEANDKGDFDMQFYVTANADGNADITDYTTGCEEYTITYYGFRGGYSTSTSSDGIIVLPVNSMHTVPNCGDVVTDHTNLGRKFLNVWMTQPHGGHTFKPGDTFILTQDTTLYAQWELETTSDVTTLPTDIEDLAGTDVYVYGGKILNIQPGTTTINSLTLKGGLQSDGSYKMPIVWVPEGATLVRNSNKIYLDLVVNAKNYYPFAVPFATKNDQYIDYLDPVLNAASTYDKHFVIKTYNGALRATNGEDRANNWVKVNRHATDKPSYLQPGVGYIIQALTYPDKDTATIRIPMTVPNTWFENGEQAVVGTTVRNTIAVTAHGGAAATEHQRHAGWNFVANPYLTSFAGGNVANGGDLAYINGELTVNGGWQYGGDDVPYVTIPAYDFSYYTQHKLNDVKLSPEWSFFVQIGTGGTMDFSTAGRQETPASIAARHDAAQSFKMDVDITLSNKNHSDQMGLIICDHFSSAYEVGYDLEKMFGSAYNLTVYTLMEDNTPLAYHALAIHSNMQVIPVGYRVPEQGDYTFALNQSTSSIDLLNEQYEQLILVDYETGALTNLLNSTYTFTSPRTQSDSRFAIYAVIRQKTPTDLPNIDDGDTSTRKILHNGHLYILRDGKVYNGHGQIVK